MGSFVTSTPAKIEACGVGFRVEGSELRDEGCEFRV
jgi:hypothetical protein